MNKANLISAILGLLIGAALIWYLYPRTQDKIEYRDRVKVETRIVTRIVERKALDGSSTTETEIVDTGSATRDTSLVALKAAQKQYVVGIGTAYNWGHFQAPDYSLTVGRRLVGPLIGAVTVSKDRLQAGLLFEF